MKPVLDHEEFSYPLDQLSLTDLTLKLTMLLALKSELEQCHTLVFLETNAMKEIPSYYLFSIQDHVKQDKPGKLFLFFCTKIHPKNHCVLILHFNIILKEQNHSVISVIY